MKAIDNGGKVIMSVEENKNHIGIVTLYDDNYGTCFQAYALCHKISELGYDPEIVRYVRGNINAQKVSGIKKILAKLKALPLNSIVEYVLSYKWIRERKRGFSDFRNRYMKFGKTTNYRDCVHNDLGQTYDAFVCGSDMIWSEEFADDWRYFFLQFAPPKKRISYAPSFGKNEISSGKVKLCSDYLREIRCRSCREEAGVSLIRNQFGLSAVQVLDPTLLMKKDEWNRIIDGQGRMLEEKYTLTYVFGGFDGKRKDFFEKISKKGWGEHRIIPMNRKQNGKNAVKGILGPIEFLRLYRDAEFIITDTFHGLIFAIIYEKPFVVLKREDKGHWAKYSDRMTSTLKMFGLENRYIGSDSVILDEWKTLDYSEVNKKLLEKRKESLKYLNDSLMEVTAKC